MLAARAQRTALCLVLLAATSIGFERIEPSLAVTPDLRITNLRLIAALALAAWLVSCGLMRRRPRVPSRVALPALLWLAMLVLSAALAPAYQTQAMAFVRDIAFGMAFGWLVYDIANTPHRQVLIAQALAISGMGVGILGLAEAARIPPVLDWLVGFRYQANFGVGELPRISSTLPHPNVAAMLLGLALPLQLAWLINSQKLWSRVVLGLGATTELAALVLTVSRAGVLVTGVALAALVLAGVWRRRPVLAWTSLSAGAGLVAVLGLSLISQPTALLHLTSESTQSWYRADYSTPAEVAAHAGEVATVPVRLTNAGDRTWSSTGNNPFELSYHLDNLDGASVTYDGPRTPLPLDLAPGESVDLQAQVVAPQSSGTYVVEWDAIQEAVTWFSWAGTPPGRTRLLVIGQPAVGVGAGSEITRTAVPNFVPPPPGRLMQWRIALRMARNRPLLGVGPDNFRWMYGDFAGVATWDTGGHANSLYFEWLADTGLPGLCLFLWLAWRLLQASSRGLFDRRVASPESRTPLPVWRLAMAVSLLTWFLHGLLDYFYEPLPTNLAFWLMAGLVLSSTRSSARNDRTVAECASPTT